MRFHGTLDTHFPQGSSSSYKHTNAPVQNAQEKSTRHIGISLRRNHQWYAGVRRTSPCSSRPHFVYTSCYFVGRKLLPWIQTTALVIAMKWTTRVVHRQQLLMYVRPAVVEQSTMSKGRPNSRLIPLHHVVNRRCPFHFLGATQGHAKIRRPQRHRSP